MASRVRRDARTAAALVVAVAVALGVAACGGNNSSSGGGASNSAASKFQEKQPLKIGYSVYDLKQPYWQTYARGIKDEAKKVGAQYVQSDQKSSQQSQVSGSADLINQQVSALIVSPVQPAALPASVNAAHAQKIPLVVGDVGAQGDYDAFVLSDNFNGGVQAAKYVVGQLKDRPGTKEVGVITLHPGSAVGEDRANGFLAELKKHPGFKVVAKLNGNDAVDQGFQVTQNMLSAHPKLAAIYAGNDPEAQGAVQALDQAGKSGVKDVLVVGFNGDSPALQLIKEGKMAATIAQDPYGQGKTAVDAAMALLNGKAVKYTKPQQKVINFPVKLVTKDNVTQFIH